MFICAPSMTKILGASKAATWATAHCLHFSQNSYSLWLARWKVAWRLLSLKLRERCDILWSLQWSRLKAWRQVQYLILRHVCFPLIAHGISNVSLDVVPFAPWLWEGTTERNLHVEDTWAWNLSLWASQSLNCPLGFAAHTTIIWIHSACLYELQYHSKELPFLLPLL